MDFDISPHMMPAKQTAQSALCGPTSAGPITPDCIAFNGMLRVAAGPLPDVALRVKMLTDRDPQARIVVLNTATSEPVEIDLQGSVDEVLRRLLQPTSAVSTAPPSAAAASASACSPAASTSEMAAGPAIAPTPPRATGRPRLGVVAREVTLMPRHWDWLSRQPGGASITLRRLVDESRSVGEETSASPQRQAQEISYRFMLAMAGKLPGFEDATHALFAKDAGLFAAHTETWPVDVRGHARQLAGPVWLSAGTAPAGP